jgi:hypothetical protein
LKVKESMGARAPPTCTAGVAVFHCLDQMLGLGAVSAKKVFAAALTAVITDEARLPSVSYTATAGTKKVRPRTLRRSRTSPVFQVMQKPLPPA